MSVAAANIVPPNVNRAMNAREWAMLVLLAIVWGGSFYFISIAVKSVPPFTLVLLRLSIAALILHLVLRFKGIHFPLDRASIKAFVTMGMIQNAIPFCLIVWGQTQIASGLASILNATTPIFTLLVMRFIGNSGEISGNKVFGVLLGIAGLVIMIGSSVFEGLGGQVMAELACLTAAFFYGFTGIAARRFQSLNIPPLTVATGTLTAAAILLLPTSLVIDQPWKLPMPGLEVCLALASLAIFSTALAYILFFKIVGSAGATNASLVTLMVPVTAILLGTYRLGETLQSKHYLGMILIGFGLVAIDGRILQFFKRREPNAVSHR